MHFLVALFPLGLVVPTKSATTSYIVIALFSSCCTAYTSNFTKLAFRNGSHHARSARFFVLRMVVLAVLHMQSNWPSFPS